jgi:hypothetical protein
MNLLRAGGVVEVAGIRLIPVERISITTQQDGSHVWLQASKEVAAVAICEAQSVRLLSVSGESLSLDEWLPQVEGLEAGLRECRSQ